MNSKKCFGCKGTGEVRDFSGFSDVECTQPECLECEGTGRKIEKSRNSSYVNQYIYCTIQLIKVNYA